MTDKTINLSDELYHYMLSVSLREPPVLQELRLTTNQLAMRVMQICPEQGQFMRWLVELMGARKTLEVGVFTGYSSLSVALALPEDGKLIACDVSEEWTTIAREFWHKAGVEHKIKLHLAPALETLDTLIEQGESGSFDFAFIDADKSNQENYYEKILVLLRRGGVVALDNAFRDGKVLEATNSKDKSVIAVDNLNKKLVHDERVSLSLIPIGDGLTLARKR